MLGKFFINISISTDLSQWFLWWRAERISARRPQELFTNKFAQKKHIFKKHKQKIDWIDLNCVCGIPCAVRIFYSLAGRYCCASAHFIVSRASTDCVELLCFVCVWWQFLLAFPFCWLFKYGAFLLSHFGRIKCYSGINCSVIIEMTIDIDSFDILYKYRHLSVCTKASFIAFHRKTWKRVLTNGNKGNHCVAYKKKLIFGRNGIVD